ncbi:MULTISPECIES: sodium:proton antiporter [unclassified Pseudomonas]|uniref:cation:proton antiporter n=1 Tax=unclassified Pseudomonas TaxID=196821 RepID=UPI00119BD1DB|nr:MULTISPECIES: sodium:proton antiporter [unclassified Pseudomonas]TWC11518.1 sodium/proton antiporter (CPA1 family) [Pseudomonas sp. SJZ083]TWC40028.1 sodium/proton antiporter (CPA1 family) [Pseudomonas sp. SJZ077]TWC44533.1 sodium/proton antiporter (CPA1 family) [Pseudomonas sp. SJZ080]
MLDIIAIFLSVTALLAYVNRRYVGLPSTIGVMGIALGISLLNMAADSLGFHALHTLEQSLVESIDFSELLMQGMLSLLLFAGALHVDLSQLRIYRWQVASLAAIGTTLSTLFIGFGLWALLSLTDLGMPLVYCLVFGALISPTDPIAVMGILKSAGAPGSVELVISGESLFNDGVSVVLFSLILAMIASGEGPSVAGAAQLLLKEAGGGALLGAVVGYVIYRMLKSIDSYQEEVLITLAAVLGAYALATHLHVSGPIATVVMGLIIGNHGRSYAMSEQTKKNLDMFWELMDEILNAVLFVLIGLEVVLIHFSNALIATGLMVVALTLLSRLLTVGVPIAVLGKRFRLPKGAWSVMTWGGLRGGISVALALSLPPSEARDTVVSLTYIIVVFSILIQGMTIGKLVRKVMPCAGR